MNTIQGDLIALAEEGRFEVIAHGCNCMCAMDAGIAKQIKDHFPEAYEADIKTKAGDASKLGTCTAATIHRNERKLTVVNAYTQFDYKGAGVLVDCEAVRSCMRWIKTHYSGKKIGLPKIGAGLAKGDWAVISQIITQELDDEDVTIVEFKPGLSK